MVATLKRPVKWQEDEDADVIFLLAFNLDDSMGMKEETVKFYSVFLDLWVKKQKWKQSGICRMGIGWQ